jgi:diguanylate cyclase (GGDEF)-like protein
MSLLVSQLAELTRHRDREQADELLADTLERVLHPLSLALHRCVGELPDRRWLTCVRRGDSTARCRRPDAFDALPTLPQRPEWLECLRQQRARALPGTPAVTLFPLPVNGTAVGVMELHTPRPLDEATRRTIEAVLLLYGNFMHLLDYGERDALTGLLNRKPFDHAVMRAVSHDAQEGASREDGTRSQAPKRHWLALLDIDHFKRINDTHGHLIGDEVLLLLARLMRGCFRFGDELFRFGGEEFVVLLSTAEEQGAVTALQRMRECVQGFEFPQAGRVTVSIGFTALRATDTPADAVDRADRALYQAKSAGRNCVVGPADMAAAGMAEAAKAEHRGDVDLF